MIDKKGQLGISIVVAITFFIIGIVAVNFLITDVTTARASSALDCSDSANISDANKLTCLAVDLVVPYFIVLVFIGSFGYIMKRLLV